jgi:hypothetical protein
MIRNKKKILIYLSLVFLIGLFWLVGETFIFSKQVLAGIPWEQTFSRSGYGSYVDFTFNTRIRNPSYQIISLSGPPDSRISWFRDYDGLIYGARVKFNILGFWLQDEWGYRYCDTTTCYRCGECYDYWGRAGVWVQGGWGDRYCDATTCRRCDGECTRSYYGNYSITIRFTGTGPFPGDPFAGIGANTRVTTGAVDVFGSNATFNWSTSGKAQNGYWFQVDDNRDFSSPVVNTGVVVSGAKSYTVSGLSDGAYYWRIGVRSSAGGFYYWTPWAYGGSFVLADPPTVSLSASPNPVDYNTASTLTWFSTNATVCTASGDWSGSKSLSGSESTGNLTSAKTYILTCTGDGGSASDSVTVDVNPNTPPIATSLSVTQGDYCVTPVHYFSWTYSDPDGDNQSQFQFQVDNNSDFSSPEVDRTYSGLSNPSPTTNNQTVVVAVSPSSDQIAYNTTYYWRVMVWDDQGAASSWTEGSSFTTEAHQYPSIDFDWSPQNPSAQEDVLFADQSTVYGGATKSNWLWDFEDGNPASSNQQNPTIQFTSSGSKQVTLQVTDSDGYACSDAKTVDVGLKLPGWKEALPE